MRGYFVYLGNRKTRGCLALFDILDARSQKTDRQRRYTLMVKPSRSAGRD